MPNAAPAYARIGDAAPARTPAAKKQKILPTLAIGQPFTPTPAAPPMRIPEPVIGVGAVTGQEHFVLGDRPDGQPEQMMVGDGTAGPQQPGQPVSMAAGGYAVIGGGSGQVNGGNYADGFSGGYDPQEEARRRERARTAQFGVFGAQQQAQDARYPTLQTQQNVYDQQYAGASTRYNGQQSVYNAQAGTFGPRRDVLNATANTFAPQQGVFAANANVLDQRNLSLGRQRGFIGQQQAANTARGTDIANVQAAAADVQDKAAVARAGQVRDVENQTYAQFGVKAADVNVPQDFKGDLPTGVRATLRTNEQYQGEKAQNNEQTRSNQLEGAALAVKLADTDLEGAQIAASRAGLTLDQAKQLVSEAQNRVGYANLGVDQAQNAAGQADARSAFNTAGAQYVDNRTSLGATAAGYGVDAANLENSRAKFGVSDYRDQFSDQGLERFTDPTTGQVEYLTPAQVDQRKYDYQQQQQYGRIGSSYDLNQARTRYGNQQSTFGNMSPTALLDAYVNNRLPSPNGSGSMATFDDVINELIKQGLTPQQATNAFIVAQTAHEQQLARANGGGGAVLAGAGVPDPRNQP